MKKKIAAMIMTVALVGIPLHLRDVGVRKEDIPALAQAAFDDVCTGGNPREASLGDIVELYHTAW